MADKPRIKMPKTQGGKTKITDVIASLKAANAPSRVRDRGPAPTVVTATGAKKDQMMADRAARDVEVEAEKAAREEERVLAAQPPEPSPEEAAEVLGLTPEEVMIANRKKAREDTRRALGELDE